MKFSAVNSFPEYIYTYPDLHLYWPEQKQKYKAIFVRESDDLCIFKIHVQIMGNIDSVRYTKWGVL